ncbi:MAG: hypothetical protein GY945_00505 [Rhodobacteraceae bacterium]|nr:hypothetical protein [Paracoccaceae bacterium]
MKVTGYSRLQISLHWLIVVLLLLQFVLNDPISEAWHKLSRGQEFTPNILVTQHVFSGILIGLLAILRIFIRLTRGAPDFPEGENAVQKLAAQIAHWALYLLMLLVPLSGVVAWFGQVRPAADGHEFLQGAMLAFIIVHVVAALFHQYVLKNNLIDRMIRAEKP